jgi:hypothetical protein
MWRREGDRGETQHVYPIEDREHITDGSPCWCDPEYYRLCTQCDMNGPECWMCGDRGLILVGRDEFDRGGPLVVIHHFESSPPEVSGP